MNLGEMISNPTSPIYYWINQTLASSLLGLSGFLVGMIFAWMIWGRRRKRLKKARADNELLSEQWETVNPAKESELV